MVVKDEKHCLLCDVRNIGGDALERARLGFSGLGPAVQGSVHGPFLPRKPRPSLSSPGSGLLPALSPRTDGDIDIGD